MSRWAAALAAHLANENQRTPPMAALTKLTKAPSVSFDSDLERGCSDFSSPIGEAANDLVPARTCADCRHRLRRGTCAEPVAAGLFTAAHGFGIVWPEPDHAATCPAFTPGAPATAPDRPHKLTPAEGDATHAQPWDDAACARFTARVGLFLRRGINAADADELAERLHLRDRVDDDRRLCLECRNLAGRTTARRCAAGEVPDLPADLVTRLQRCPGFWGVTP